MSPAVLAPAVLVRRLVLVNFLVILLVAGLTATALYRSYADHRERAEIETRNLARMLELHMDSVLARTDVSLQAAAFEFERQASQGGINPEMLNQFLHRQQSLLPEVTTLRIVDAQGTFRFGPGEPARTQVNIADRDYFIRARDNPQAGLIIGGPLLSRVINKWIVVLVRRLNGPDGSFAGIVVASIQADYFQALLAQMNPDQQWALSLRTGDLRLIARHPGGENIQAAIGTDNLSPLVLQALAANPERGTCITHSPLDGLERTLSYARLPKYPLYVIAALSSAAYMPDWQWEAFEEGLLAIFVILSVSGSSVLLYRGWINQRNSDNARVTEALRNQQLLQTASDGIAILDRTGRLIEVNEAFCQQLGYSRAELTGMNISDIDAALTQEQIGEMVRDVSGSRKVFESRHRGKDGREVDVEISAAGVEIDGQPLVFCSAREISERKKAEAEQKRLGRTLELLGNSNMAVLHADQEQKLLSDICRLIVEGGGYIMAWVGLAENDAERTVRPVASSGYEEGYLDSIQVTWADTELGRGPTGTAIRTGKTKVNESVFTNPAVKPWREAAAKRGYQSSIGLPLLIDGAVAGALTIYAAESAAFSPDEIALLEKLTNNLSFGIERLRARTRLASANKELEGFTYAASHDMKAPLGRILSFSGLLEQHYRDRLEGDGLLFLDFIRQNAERVRVLIDDLLAHAQVGQKSSAAQPIVLQAAVKALLEERKAEILQAGAEIRLGIPPATVLAHHLCLSQVLRNLLENALKYAADSTPPVIEIGGEVRESAYRLWVRDNGIGFDMAYHDRIFEIFRRLHTYAEFPGTGIGLALVKKAVEHMGGRVWAESAPGQGATFFLELQLAPTSPLEEELPAA